MTTTQEIEWSVLLTGPDPSTIYTYAHAFCFSRTSSFLIPQELLFGFCLQELLQVAIH